MDLDRFVVSWSGPQVKGAAVNVLHFASADAVDPADVLAAYQELDGCVPQGVTITVPSTGDVIDDQTGQITGGWARSGGGSFSSNLLTQNAAAGCGANVTWDTATVINGRRMRGRTFLVPLGAQVYEADGTLSSGTLALVNAFATALRAAGGLRILRRPGGPTGPGGTSGAVTGHRVPDHVSVLRSRRY